MRSIVALGAVATAVLLASSCDTTQPLQLEQQVFELNVRASGAQINTFNVWDGFEDNNGDMQPDDTNGDGNPDTFLHCVNRNPDSVDSHITSSSSLPYGFTVSISIVRAGQTEAEVITGAVAATEPSHNVASYDTANPRAGQVPAAPAPVTISGRTFRFRSGRILSRGRRDVVAQTTSPLVELAPGTYGTVGSGRCSLFDPGPARVDDTTATDFPRRIVLGKGDTVTIEAALVPTASPGIPVLNPPQPALASDFTLNGQPVIVRGFTSEENGAGTGFRFSYTTR